MHRLLVLFGVVTAMGSISCASPGGEGPRGTGAPADLRRLLNGGRAHMMKLEYGEAAELYREAGRRYPNRSACFRLQGRALFALGRFREASAAYQKAIGIYPRSAHVPHDLRNRFADTEILDARLAELAARVRENSGDSDLVFLLAYYYHLLDRSEAAAPLFQRLSEAGFAMTSHFVDAPP